MDCYTKRKIIYTTSAKLLHHFPTLTQPPSTTTPQRCETKESKNDRTIRTIFITVAHNPSRILHHHNPSPSPNIINQNQKQEIQKSKSN
jgi:hypothetical protein